MQVKNNRIAKAGQGGKKDFTYYYNYIWLNLDSLWKHIILAFFIYAEAQGHHFAWEQQISGKSLYGWAIIIGMESVLILLVKYITNPEYKEEHWLKFIFGFISTLIILVQVGMGTLILTSGYSNALANVKQYELYTYQQRELSKSENESAALINDCLARVWTKSDKEACQQRGASKKILQNVIVSEKDRKMVEQWDSFAATFNGGIQDKTHVKGKVLNTVSILVVALIITLSKLALMGASVHKTKKEKEEFERKKNEAPSQEKAMDNRKENITKSPANYSYIASSTGSALFEKEDGSKLKTLHTVTIDKDLQNAKRKTVERKTEPKTQNDTNVVNINQAKTQKDAVSSVANAQNTKNEGEVQSLKRKTQNSDDDKPRPATEEEKDFVAKMRDIANKTKQGKMFRCAVCGEAHKRNGRKEQYSCPQNSTCRGVWGSIVKGGNITPMQLGKINRFMSEVKLKRDVM